MNFEDFAVLLGQKPWLKDMSEAGRVAEDLWRRWGEPHRVWHGREHLLDLLGRTAGAPEAMRFPLVLAVAFHDAIYDPRRNDNEWLSADLFQQMAALPDAEKDQIVAAIDDTATGVPSTPLSEHLLAMDRRILSSTDFHELLSWERSIAREYQYVSWPDYVAGRTDFLEANGLIALAGYVRAHRPHIGIYAGSFDPFHEGHLNILTRAEEIFEKVIVAVGINPDKRSGDVESRVERVRQALPFHEVVAFSGLLTELVAEVSAYATVTLIRGLRDGYDLQQEINQARFLEDISPGVRMAWIPCDRRFQHISSSAIRALGKFDAEKASGYLPDRFAYARELSRAQP